VNGSIRSDQSPDFYSCVAKKSRGFSDKKREEKGRLGLVIWIVLHRKGSVCSLWESFSSRGICFLRFFIHRLDFAAGTRNRLTACSAHTPNHRQIVLLALTALPQQPRVCSASYLPPPALPAPPPAPAVPILALHIPSYGAVYMKPPSDPMNPQNSLYSDGPRNDQIPMGNWKSPYRREADGDDVGRFEWA